MYVTEDHHQVLEKNCGGLSAQSSHAKLPHQMPPRALKLQIMRKIQRTTNVMLSKSTE